MLSRVGVIGAGYVGLTTAACLAQLGHDVVCADVDVEKLARLGAGDVPILEDGLPDLVRAGLGSGRLSFVLGAAAAAGGAEFVFVCVPTPQGSDAAADLSYVEAALREMGPVLDPEAVVVTKSTMPPGSTRFVQRILHEECGCDRVAVASNPEFLREGSAVADFMNPDRIVIGCHEPTVAVRVSSLFKGIQAPLLVTDCASAEMIKYASNTFLATKVSFVNAIANLCESFDADVRAVTLGMGYDRRIGFEFLAPGPGYGGSCLPKDTAALIRAAETVDYDFSLLRGVAAINEAQYDRIIDKIRIAGGTLHGTRVAVLGLTFKAGSDDLRDSPALEIVSRLLGEGALVAAYDPVAGAAAAEALTRLTRREVVIPEPEVVLAGDGHPARAVAPAGRWESGEVAVERFFVAPDAYEACRGAAVMAVLTEWDEFRWLDFTRVAGIMRHPVVVDARNLLDPAALRRCGFSYQGVGR